MRHRHLLDFAEWSVPDIEALFNTTEVMAQVLTRTIKKVPALQGFHVAHLFFEDSTRTRVSFERAARAQTADVSVFAAGSSSLSKGESLRDTIRTIEQSQVDLYVVRHPVAGTPHRLRNWTDAAIINAGDGRRAHPTQALLDAYTARQHLGELAGRRLVIVGDVQHSRVARSNIELFTKFGAEVVLSGPPTLVPAAFAGIPGVRIETDLRKAADGADMLMALRIQHERLAKQPLLPSVSEYRTRWEITEEHVALANDGCLLMHPGPTNWDVDIASSLRDYEFNVIEQQVANGVSVRMAVLYTLLVGER